MAQWQQQGDADAATAADATAAQTGDGRLARFASLPPPSTRPPPQPSFLLRTHTDSQRCSSRAIADDASHCCTTRSPSADVCRRRVCVCVCCRPFALLLPPLVSSSPCRQNRLFIGNLPVTAERVEVEDLFRPFGSVTNVWIAKNVSCAQLCSAALGRRIAVDGCDVAFWARPTCPPACFLPCPLLCSLRGSVTSSTSQLIRLPTR